MKTISYSECLKEMFALGRFGIKLELDIISGILERLGSPEKKFCSIHIAGTNGKGSIASYITSILRSSGFSVGLYTSPHLIKFNERFCINGNMVSDEDIVESFLAVKNADTGERQATFFEIATAMAFYLFAKESVDWAVIETGMGGRLDATNILQPTVTVISNLSIEHTEYLGNTIEQIAAEKGGIIKPLTPLVTGVSQKSALAVLNDIAKTKSAPVYQYGKEFSTIHDDSSMTHDSEHSTPSSLTSSATDKLGLNYGNAPSFHQTGTEFTYRGIDTTWNKMITRLSGPHQIQNSALALATCELLMKLNIGGITEKTIREGLAATTWPGRLEYILKKPLVLIDGAHNLDAAENLGKYLQKHHNHKNSCQPSPDFKKHGEEEVSGYTKKDTCDSGLTMIIGILSDKPYKEMLTHMLVSADRVIFTKAKIDRSIDPAILRDFASTITNAQTMIIENVGEAVEHAIDIASARECICIAGSLYVAGEAREKILKDFLLQP